jgi:hypothetical protein
MKLVHRATSELWRNDISEGIQKFVMRLQVRKNLIAGIRGRPRNVEKTGRKLLSD